MKTRQLRLSGHCRGGIYIYHRRLGALKRKGNEERLGDVTWISKSWPVDVISGLTPQPQRLKLIAKQVISLFRSMLISICPNRAAHLPFWENENVT
jgi:hypothetical protein